MWAEGLDALRPCNDMSMGIALYQYVGLAHSVKAHSSRYEILPGHVSADPARHTQPQGTFRGGMWNNLLSVLPRVLKIMPLACGTGSLRVELPPQTLCSAQLLRAVCTLEGSFPCPVLVASATVYVARADQAAGLLHQHRYCPRKMALSMIYWRPCRPPPPPPPWRCWGAPGEDWPPSRRESYPSGSHWRPCESAQTQRRQQSWWAMWAPGLETRSPGACEGGGEAPQAVERA